MHSLHGTSLNLSASTISSCGVRVSIIGDILFSRVARSDVWALTRRLAAGERWDLVFNIAEGLVGRNREAQVPALCELLGIPYTGSGKLGSAIGWDKDVAKRLFLAAGVPKPGWIMGGAPAALQVLPLGRLVMVFVPTAIHPFTGYLAFVPEDQVRPLNLSPEDAMKMEFSAGFYRPKSGWLNAP